MSTNLNLTTKKITVTIFSMKMRIFIKKNHKKTARQLIMQLIKDSNYSLQDFANILDIPRGLLCHKLYRLGNFTVTEIKRVIQWLELSSDDKKTFLKGINKLKRQEIVKLRLEKSLAESKSKITKYNDAFGKIDFIDYVSKLKKIMR